ncbi:hypothetical protein [Bacillus safensis]|uniref:hypothetical protein n=1 Tax=Bacillus safensis TaxID=561879 RepID=UPI002281EF0C|nr:hypothetical protein [Bacillus safensis]MCY7473006.1 hypothetical protein [Bacillus safensis]
MAQGLIGGMTPYGDQSLDEIKVDLNNWKVYAERILNFFSEKLEYLQQQKYMNNVPYNLQCVFFETIRKTKTFIYDIEIIKKSIAADRITKKEVTLLKNIGTVSFKTNREYGTTYHEDTSWHEYDDANFRIAEKLYQDGRDFFVTLQDSSNAADRLENYMSTDSSNTTNFINNAPVNNLQQGNNNSMVIGDQFTGANYEQANELLEQILKNLDKYFGEDQSEKKEEAQQCIELVQAELVNEKPKKGILRGMLNSLPFLNDSADFLSKVTEVSQKLGLL